MRKLLDICLMLEGEDLRALSAIWIERGNYGEWQARCNIARYKYREPQAHAAGIAMMSWERVPDQIYPLMIDEFARDESVREQVRELQASGIVGRIDMARYDSCDKSTAYLIKTHAGSQAERTRWLLALKQRPENMIYLRGDES